MEKSINLKDLTNPAKLIALTKEYDLTPSKKYGQNYLISERTIRKIIKASELNSKDTVIEIGPGFGILTIPVAAAVKKVIAIELEKKLQPYWKGLQGGHKNIEIIWGNALTKFVDVVEDLNSYKVVANLPYQITGKAIRTILSQDNLPEAVVIMVQKEVGQRICAGPGEMSVLALSVQYYADPEVIATVSSGSFWPQPKVDSVVVRFNMKDKRLGDKEFEKKFFQFVKAGFSSKRKQLWSNLHKNLGLPKDKVKQVLDNILGDDRVRAEVLTVEDWIDVVKKFSK